MIQPSLTGLVHALFATQALRAGLLTGRPSGTLRYKPLSQLGGWRGMHIVPNGCGCDPAMIQPSRGAPAFRGEKPGKCRIDIGRRSLAFPVTPPYVRVRIRRFDELLPCRTAQRLEGQRTAPPMVVAPLDEFQCRLHPLPTRSSSTRRLIGWRTATHETPFPTTPSHRSGLRSSRNYYALC